MRRVLIIVIALCFSPMVPATAQVSALMPTGRIAFTSDRDTGTTASSQIYVVNADGSGLTKLTNFSWWALQPTWSPDGTQIAFMGVKPEAFFKGDFGLHGNGALRGHRHDIYVMNADGSHVHRISESNEGKIGDQAPAWSPDGTKIAFTRGCIPNGCDSPPQIAVMNPDGSDLTEITSGPHTTFRPTWSPDGTKIAYERDSLDFSSAELFVMNRDGTGQTKIVSDLPPWPDGATWSPDGTKLAFWNASIPGVQVVDIVTKQVTTLADAAELGPGQTGDRWVSWSADGAWLALGSCCEGSDGVDLYLVSADGATILPVPHGRAATSPAWQPLPTI